MDSKSKGPAAVTVEGVKYTKIPGVGTLGFFRNPTKDKFINPPERRLPEIDLFCPDLTAFAFLIRGDMLDPVVPDGRYAVFSQAKAPVEKDFVLAQMKSGLNFFGRVVSFSDDKKHVQLLILNGEPVTLPMEDISLLSRMIFVADGRRFAE